MSLPSTGFVPRSWKIVRANSDYHVEVEHHWYSVPHELAHEELEACFTGTIVEILYGRSRIASHVRSFEPHAHTTDPSHRPPNHKAWAERDPGGLVEWAEKTGPNAVAMMQRIFECNIHRGQTWRSGRALMRMGETYGAGRTEVACERALRFGARSYKPIERMLKNELDLRPHPDDAEPMVSPIEHDQTRGPDYFVN